jgi:hypothetical protein
MSLTTPPSFDAAAVALHLSDDRQGHGGSQMHASNDGSYDRLSQPATSRDAAFGDDENWMLSQRLDALATGAEDYGGCGIWNDTNYPTASRQFRREWNQS